jgi:hypothetical protein
LRVVLWLAVLLPAACAYAQHGGLNRAPSLLPDSIEATSLDTQAQAQNPQPASQPPISGEIRQPNPPGAQPPGQATPPSQVQPRRILGVIPNFRAVSPRKIPPPASPKQAFRTATKNTFDYSTFVSVGLSSAFAETRNAHPRLGKGLPGFGRYYWRVFADRADSNYMVFFAFPSIFHQDGRYYALGRGRLWKRITYAASRVLITRDYQGHNCFNISELLGRGIAAGISTAYYPDKAWTIGAVASKFGFAVGGNALSNTFREFWPDIAVRLLHRHP